MSFDNYRNLASSRIQTAPTNKVTGEIFELLPGDGGFFAANMPVTFCPSGESPSPDNSEIGFIRAITGDTITVTRGQEGTSAKSVEVGWSIFGSITARTLTQFQEAIAASADKHFTQTFNVTNSVSVAHGLNKYPSVMVLDSAGDEVYGEVHHVDVNNLTVAFSGSFSGRITCN